MGWCGNDGRAGMTPGGSSQGDGERHHPTDAGLERGDSRRAQRQRRPAYGSARRQDCFSGFDGGSSRLPPGGLRESHLLRGISLGPVPLMTIPRLRLLCVPLACLSLDGMTTSLGVARAPSRLLVGLSLLAWQLAAGRLVRGPHLGRGFPWTRSSVNNCSWPYDIP